MAKKNKSKKNKKDYYLIPRNKTNSTDKILYVQTRRKKPKRLGKTCIYFDINKLSCKTTGMFCTNAEKCKNYVEIPQKMTIQKHITKVFHEVDNVGITAIVLCNNRKCTNSNHTIIDVQAKIRIAKTNGKITNYIIPAAYCKICDMYFVLKKDFMIAKEQGVILCPVIDMTPLKNGRSRVVKTSTSESRIHQLGYNVKKGSGYSAKQRQTILANILENTDISKHEIESCILRPMLQHKSQASYADAISAWNEDLSFIKNYKMGDLPEVIVEKIIIGKRNH